MCLVFQKLEMSFQLRDKLDHICSCVHSKYIHSLPDSLEELQQTLEFSIVEISEVNAANEAIFVDKSVFFYWLNRPSDEIDDVSRVSLIGVLKMWTEKNSAEIVSKFAKAAFEKLFMFIKNSTASAKTVAAASECLMGIIQKCGSRKVQNKAQVSRSIT